MLVKTSEKFERLRLSRFGKIRKIQKRKNLILSAAKHVRRILESALLCGFYEFLHRSKFVLGQHGDCGLNETIFGMIRFEFKL